MDHEGGRGPSGSGGAARGGRRLTDLLQRSFGVTGTASPQELKARYRALAQLCALGDAPAEELERLRLASVAVAQELAILGLDRSQVEGVLAGEGCPGSAASEAADAIAGTVSRRVTSPLERETVTPVDEAYMRLAERTLAAESARALTASGYGLGFIIRLAVAFVVVIGALIAGLDVVPRALRPAKVDPAPVTIQLLPPEKSK